jgi:thimet oligopeptidase
LRDGATPTSLERLCAENLLEARRRLDAIAAAPARGAQPLEWDPTFGRFDDVLLAVANASEYAYLMGVVHPDEPMRVVAAECERRVDAFETEIYLDIGVAKVLATAAANGAEPRSEERQRFVQHVLRAFSNNGVNLPEEGRTRLRALNDALTETGQAFIEALAAPDSSVRVSTAALRGTSEAYRRRHPPGPDGLVAIGAEPTDAIEFYAHTRDRNAARRVYTAFVNRGGRANVARLEALLALRHEKARLLGFDSWADYVTSSRMMKNAATVGEFLHRIERALAPLVESELNDLRAVAKRTPQFPATTKLEDPDRVFLLERQRAERLDADTSLFADYFEVDSVTETLFNLAGSLFGVTFQERATATWHASVKSYDVHREGQLIGQLYLDRFARPNKYPNPATFSVRTGRKGKGTAIQLPASAIVAALPAPGMAMHHEAVVMYFHEFGHALQQLLSENELGAFSGTNATRDFIETPSQVFEEWAWQRPVLERLARHRTTGAPMPKGLLDALLASRRIGLALSLQRQLFLAELDLAFHTQAPPFDTTALLREVQAAHYPFAPLEGTHVHSSFSHFVGYDAAYYGYTLSQALAADAWTRFESDPNHHAQTAEDWRRTVLAWGGARDERAMLRAFLGRDPNERALLEFVRGSDPPRIGAAGTHRAQ